MRTISGMVLTAALMAAAWTLGAQTVFDPHGDPVSGVLRIVTNPPSRGECQQCHPAHGADEGPVPSAPVLFAENTNRIAFWDQGDGPCHRRRPDNYPLVESDRMPDSEPDPGYFEANAGGLRRVGVQYRGRWPGERIWSDPDLTPAGKFYSPHAMDPDMPRRDPDGQGSCLNCHDPHAAPSRRDLLILPYGGIGGHASMGAPAEYALCFSCHGRGGPPGMDPESRFIEDYYDPALNRVFGGHRILRNPDVALYWPPHIREGDMLPCYDCHNPHGSAGENGVEPNAFLLSDQRPEWSGLSNTLTDPVQNRRFCFGCHIPSDGIPGTKEVEGIVMNTIPDRPYHRISGTKACNECHGGDYSDARSHNVHNPKSAGGP